MGATASFAATPRAAVVDVSAANTNRDGTDTIVAAFTAGASGSRIERIAIVATGTTTAGMVRSFKRIGAGTWHLWREYQISAIVPSASVQAASTMDDEIGEILPNNTWEIGFSTHNAEAFKVHVMGGDF